MGELNDVPLYIRDFPEGEILCVLENRPMQEPEKAFQIPVVHEKHGTIRVHEEQLAHTFTFINRVLKDKSDLLVHCLGGFERSPLVIAYFLSKNFGITLDDAYKKVKQKRPQIMNRSDWIIGVKNFG